MKAKIASLITGAGAAACMALAGCGGSDNGGMATTPAAPMSLDTAQVLGIVKAKTSETAAPFQVNGGAVVITPADDETSEPVSVDGP